MVEKFNFYDIYGYLLPGLALIGLLWTPFGLFWHVWPQQEISSAILILLLAYIAGHFMQGLAFSIFPSKINGREPSDLLLDKGDTGLTQQTKSRINELSKKHFGLDLETAADQKTVDDANREYCGLDLETAADPKTVDYAIRGRRGGAFFQARSVLLKSKKENASYWEQFEGLYALMRGMTLALGAASAYFLGWAIGLPEKDVWLGWAGWFLLFSGTATVIFALAQKIAKRPKLDGKAISGKKKHDWPKIFTFGIAVSLAFALLGSGMLAARNTVEHTRKASLEHSPAAVACFLSVCTSVPESKDSKPDEALIGAENRGFVMLLLALAAAVVSIRCHEAYKAFAREFALAVWRDFANFEVMPPKTESS